MTDLDLDGVRKLVEHIVYDFTYGAPDEHLEQLFMAALAESPQQAYLVLAVAGQITADLVRLCTQPALEHAAVDGFFGLTVEARPGVDLEAPDYRGRLVAMQTFTAQLNGDSDTAAALVAAAVSAPDGPSVTPYALIAVLEVFRSFHHTEAGKAAALELGIFHA